MSGFVCMDANIAVKWVLIEEDRDLAFALYEESIASDVTIVVPPHMTTEVVNAIRRKVARQLLTADEGQDALARFLDFQVEIATPSDLHRSALTLAETLGHPAVYDSHYIALAQIYKCDFWTADQRLLDALNGRLPFVRSLSDYQPATAT